MATRATPSPINLSTSGTRTGWASGAPLGGAPGATGSGAAGSAPAATPGGAPEAAAAAAPQASSSFFTRYQNVARGDLNTLKKAVGVVGGAALSTVAFGYGFVRQSVLHPILTIQDVGAEFGKLSQKVSDGAKGAVQGMEERLMKTELTQLSAKIRTLSALSEAQKAKVVSALETSMGAISIAQTERLKRGSSFTLPFKYVADTWKTMAAVRSHERLVDVLGSAAKFSEKYAKDYPDKCSGYFEKIVDDMSDGRMSPFEWFARRANLAAAGITNRFLRAVDPFRAHADYKGSGASA